MLIEGEYLFLFLLGGMWIVFAVVQDLRTREISNWLTFSLIGIVLAYRAFYSLESGDLDFFLFGVFGVAAFWILGYVFYYGRVFAGGDVKLLRGIGGILPYKNLMDLVFLGGGFILILFSAGAIYTLIYSVFLVGGGKDKGKFRKIFGKMVKKWKYGILISFVFAIVFFVLLKDYSPLYGGIMSGILLLMPWIYIYTKTVDKACMVRYVSANDLVEGDWLEEDIKVGRRVIKMSVHGLSIDEIKLLRKSKKKILIKDGVPFGPAFLIGFLAFIYLLRNFSW